MKGMLVRMAVAAFAVLAGGCATAPQWERYQATAGIESPEKGFTLQAPAGWRRSPVEKGDRIVLTMDGFGIQQLVLSRFDVDKAFPLTKARPAKDVSPREFGELLLAELRAGEKDSRIELKSSGETRIDGRPAFRLHLTERTARGAQYERIVAAVRGETKIFWTSCTALARYYFERARPVCEQTIATVRLAPL
ncbi:MAG: hypothetical protein ACLGHB_00985 [Gammaproteobacteria bacterium]